MSEPARRLVALHPRGHANVFRRDLYREDAFCLTCHHLQLRGTVRQDEFLRPTCRDCHMQPRDLLGREGNRKNHLFLGANISVPHFVGNQPLVDLTRRWIEGDLLLSNQDSFWELRTSQKQAASRAFWLVMSFDPASPARTGQVFRLKVLTSNVGIGHDFPSAPLELIEAWLEVSASTADGREFFATGRLDGTGRVPAGAHTLGGYMLDAAGRRIERNRVWMTEKKVVERSIPPGRTIEDEFEIAIPENVGDKISVKARWNYRKLNREFVDWAFPGEHVAIPSAEVVAAEQSFTVDRQEAL